MIGWLISCIVVDGLAIVANVGEQLLIYKNWSSLDRIDHLLLSLSISDLTNSVCIIIMDGWFLLKQLDVVSDLPPSSTKIMVKVFDSVFVLSIFASIFHVIAVAIERLYAIRFPRKYYMFTTFTFKCTTIVTVWSASLVFTCIFSTLSVLSLDRQVGKYIRASAILISAFTVFVIYIYIVYLLLLKRKIILQDFSTDYSLQRNWLTRLTVLCLVIGFGFVICVLPITLAYFHRSLYHPVANFMVPLNSLLNPCVYFVKVYHEQKNAQTRGRSETVNALIDNRWCTVAIEANEEMEGICNLQQNSV